MVSKSPPEVPSSPRSRRRPLEGIASKRWRQLERFAKAFRSLGDKLMTQADAERLTKRFGVYWSTATLPFRMRVVDEATAIDRRTRG